MTFNQTLSRQRQQAQKKWRARLFINIMDKFFSSLLNDAICYIRIEEDLSENLQETNECSMSDEVIDDLQYVTIAKPLEPLLNQSSLIEILFEALSHEKSTTPTERSLTLSCERLLKRPASLITSILQHCDSELNHFDYLPDCPQCNQDPARRMSESLSYGNEGNIYKAFHCFQKETWLAFFQLITAGGPTNIINKFYNKYSSSMNSSFRLLDSVLDNGWKPIFKRVKITYCGTPNHEPCWDEVPLWKWFLLVLIHIVSKDITECHRMWEWYDKLDLMQGSELHNLSIIGTTRCLGAVFHHYWEFIRLLTRCYIGICELYPHLHEALSVGSSLSHHFFMMDWMTKCPQPLYRRWGPDLLRVESLLTKVVQELDNGSIEQMNDIQVSPSLSRYRKTSDSVDFLATLVELQKLLYHVRDCLNARPFLWNQRIAGKVLLLSFLLCQRKTVFFGLFQSADSPSGLLTAMTYLVAQCTSALHECPELRWIFLDLPREQQLYFLQLDIARHFMLYEIRTQPFQDTQNSGYKMTYEPVPKSVSLSKKEHSEKSSLYGNTKMNVPRSGATVQHQESFQHSYMKLQNPERHMPIKKDYLITQDKIIPGKSSEMHQQPTPYFCNKLVDNLRKKVSFARPFDVISKIQANPITYSSPKDEISPAHMDKKFVRENDLKKKSYRANHFKIQAQEPVVLSYPVASPKLTHRDENSLNPRQDCQALEKQITHKMSTPEQNTQLNNSKSKLHVQPKQLVTNALCFHEQFNQLMVPHRSVFMEKLKDTETKLQKAVEGLEEKIAQSCSASEMCLGSMLCEEWDITASLPNKARKKMEQEQPRDSNSVYRCLMAHKSHIERLRRNYFLRQSQKSVAERKMTGLATGKKLYKWQKERKEASYQTNNQEISQPRGQERKPKPPFQKFTYERPVEVSFINTPIESSCSTKLTQNCSPTSSTCTDSSERHVQVSAKTFCQNLLTSASCSDYSDPLHQNSFLKFCSPVEKTSKLASMQSLPNKEFTVQAQQILSLTPSDNKTTTAFLPIRIQKSQVSSCLKKDGLNRFVNRFALNVCVAVSNNISQSQLTFNPLQLPSSNTEDSCFSRTTLPLTPKNVSGLYITAETSNYDNGGLQRDMREIQTLNQCSENHENAKHCNFSDLVSEVDGSSQKQSSCGQPGVVKQGKESSKARENHDEQAIDSQTSTLCLNSPREQQLKTLADKLCLKGQNVSCSKLHESHMNDTCGKKLRNCKMSRNINNCAPGSRIKTVAPGLKKTSLSGISLNQAKKVFHFPKAKMREVGKKKVKCVPKQGEVTPGSVQHDIRKEPLGTPFQSNQLMNDSMNEEPAQPPQLCQIDGGKILVSHVPKRALLKEANTLAQHRRLIRRTKFNDPARIGEHGTQQRLVNKQKCEKAKEKERSSYFERYIQQMSLLQRRIDTLQNSNLILIKASPRQTNEQKPQAVQDQIKPEKKASTQEDVSVTASTCETLVTRHDDDFSNYEDEVFDQYIEQNSVL